jgi:hypothetical protein
VSVQNSINYEWIVPIVGERRTMNGLLTGGGELRAGSRLAEPAF